jgi:hypothetical protein
LHQMQLRLFWCAWSDLSACQAAAVLAGDHMLIQQGLSLGQRGRNGLSVQPARHAPCGHRLHRHHDALLAMRDAEASGVGSHHPPRRQIVPASSSSHRCSHASIKRLGRPNWTM